MKKSKVLLLLTLIITFVTSTFSVQAPQSGGFYYANAQSNVQLTNYWCWAAVAQDLASTHVSNYALQSDIVNHIKDFPDPTANGTMNDIANAATYLTGNQYYYFAHPGTVSKTQIMLLLSINWAIGTYNFYADDNTHPHAMLINYYDASDDTVFIFDPWKNSANQWVSLWNYINAGVKSGADALPLKWKHSIY